MLRLLPASLLALVSTVCAAPAFAQPRPAPVTDSLARMNELGTLFATIAGMLNLIVFIDAAVHGRKRRSNAVTE